MAAVPAGRAGSAGTAIAASAADRGDIGAVESAFAAGATVTAGLPHHRAIIAVAAVAADRAVGADSAGVRLTRLVRGGVDTGRAQTAGTALPAAAAGAPQPGVAAGSTGAARCAGEADSTGPAVAAIAVEPSAGSTGAAGGAGPAGATHPAVANQPGISAGAAGLPCRAGRAVAAVTVQQPAVPAGLTWRRSVATVAN
ncbi:hypothetical protein B586_20060 [Mycobacterium haemophilum DSM 44634]|nr:hypothetical protein B586_20060 [Mycobacterium haemophilum DSM 44634]